MKTSRCISWAFKEAKEPEIKCQHSMEKAREFQKDIYIGCINYAKAFDCVDHNKLWKILKEMGILDHLTCLLRNLYVGQKATERYMEQLVRLVPNWERSTSRLYIVTLLI